MSETASETAAVEPLPVVFFGPRAAQMQPELSDRERLWEDPVAGWSADTGDDLTDDEWLIAQRTLLLDWGALMGKRDVAQANRIVDALNLFADLGAVTYVFHVVADDAGNLAGDGWLELECSGSMTPAKLRAFVEDFEQEELSDDERQAIAEAEATLAALARIDGDERRSTIDGRWRTSASASASARTVLPLTG